MKRVFLLLYTLGVSYLLTAQSPLEDSLKRELGKAVKDADKISRLSDLSRYYMGIDNALADRYARQMIEIAEVSRNRALMVEAYLNNAQRFYDYAGSQDALTKGLDFSHKAFELAKSSGLDDYTALGYVYLSRGNRVNGEIDKAVNFSNLAVALATNGNNDSVKVISWLTLGNTYMAKNEKLLAFRNYLLALDVAEQDKRYELLRSVYSSLSNFYNTLNDYEKAKDFEFKKVTLQRTNNQLYDLLDTYNSIGTIYRNARQYDLAERFYEHSIALADTLRFDISKVNGYINLVNVYLMNSQYEKGLTYFNAHPELITFLKNAGMDFFVYQALGSMYTFVNKLDSAAYFFKLAGPAFESRATKGNKYFFYSNYAYYFQKRSDYDQAIACWMKAKELGADIENLDLLQLAAQNLDTLYQLKGDFKNAHVYNSLYYQYKDSLQKLTKEKDLLSLEIDNENRRKEREARQKEAELTRRHNIQYMGIVIAIAAIFILLVMAGIFRVSKTTIKVLGFFAFIFLFEFIILLADHKIHAWTHGEPWKVMAIKILLIALLLPLHHWLEEKVIHYLTSQKLLQVKGKNLWDKWFRKNMKPDVGGLKSEA